MLRRSPFTLLMGVMLLAVSSAIAQTTGAPAAPAPPGGAPGTGLAGSWSNFWWITIAVVVVVLAAIFFAWRSRTRGRL